MAARPSGLGEILIPAINRLQDIFSQASLDFTLDLPQIAVVGSQSSGKSSVLEALVGRDFLPRGPEICTRRPLVLQLIRTTGPNAVRDGEWGEFLHTPGKRWYDFDKIRSEIQAETDRETGTNKGVSSKPIRLSVFSPHVLTMTLVDLPGITRVPVGDQPTDIEQRIRSMILEYIAAPTCLILAVTAANVDLANSDALQLARAVDPEGVRTLGVLTKVDIMDRGTDAAPVLRNQVVPLRLGYVAVVNRSQADIASSKPLTRARGDEDTFFASRPEYRDLRERCGTSNLARTLNNVLVQHIQAVLPDLRARVEGVLLQRAKELAAYGEIVPEGTGNKGGLLLRLLHAYAESFTRMLDGRSDNLPTNELAGGARIRHIFQEIFVTGLTGLDPCKDLTEADIKTAIKNSGGVKGSLLIPDTPFEGLVRNAIRRLLAPSLQCNQFVFEELLKIASQAQVGEMGRFPGLQKALEETVMDFIEKGSAPAEKMIRDLLECELAHINTSHPNFIGGSQAVAHVVDRRRQAPPPAPERERGREGPTARHVASHPIHQQSRDEDGVELYDPMELVVQAQTQALGQGDSHANAHPHKDTAGGGFFTSWIKKEKDAPRAPHGRPLPPGATPEPKPLVSLNEPPRVLHVGAPEDEQEALEVEVTRLLVRSYFDVVRGNLQDMVPKAVMHFLVAQVQRNLHQHLIQKLYRDDLVEALLAEREDVVALRTRCRDAVHALRAALATLDALPREMSRKIAAGSMSLSGPTLAAAAAAAPNNGAAPQHYTPPPAQSGPPELQSFMRSPQNASPYTPPPPAHGTPMPPVMNLGEMTLEDRGPTPPRARADRDARLTAPAPSPPVENVTPPGSQGGRYDDGQSPPAAYPGAPPESARQGAPPPSPPAPGPGGRGTPTTPGNPGASVSIHSRLARLGYGIRGGN